MQGKVLSFNPDKSRGLITGRDGRRYKFYGRSVSERFDAIEAGARVDFEINGEFAEGIYPVVSSPSHARVSGDKSKIAAALLAFFLGSLGVHKFYLGKTSAGVIMLICTLCGYFLWFLFLPLLLPVIMGIIAFIEFIIYLVTSDEDFERKYVAGDRAWF
jgi:TM2 domain-containing membrane protein YozV/cold shock CspA family protein